MSRFKYKYLLIEFDQHRNEIHRSEPFWANPSHPDWINEAFQTLTPHPKGYLAGLFKVLENRRIRLIDVRYKFLGAGTDER